jgi:hypothetical protein
LTNFVKTIDLGGSPPDVGFFLDCQNRAILPTGNGVHFWHKMFPVTFIYYSQSAVSMRGGCFDIKVIEYCLVCTPPPRGGGQNHGFPTILVISSTGPLGKKVDFFDIFINFLTLQGGPWTMVWGGVRQNVFL